MHEENMEIIRKCQTLKLEVDEMSHKMGLLALNPSEENAEKMRLMNLRASRIIRHLHRYRRHQVHLVGY